MKLNTSPAAALWIAWFITAANLVVAKFAVPYINSAVFIFVSCALAGVCFIPHLNRTNGWAILKDRKLWPQFLAMGTFGTALPMTIFMIALNYTTPTNGAILNQFEIIYSLLLSYFILGEKPSKMQLGGSALIIAGVTLLLISAGFSPRLKGDLMIISCLWMFQISHICAKKLPAHLDPQLIAAARALFALPALFLLIIYIVCTGGLVLKPSITLGWTLAFSVFINYFIGNTFWYFAIRHMDLGKATAVILSYPVMTFILAVLLGQDRITLSKVLGLALAMSGAYIVTSIVKKQGEAS